MSSYDDARKDLILDDIRCAEFFAEKHDRDNSQLLDVPPLGCSGFWAVMWICVYTFFGAVISGHEGLRFRASGSRAVHGSGQTSRLGSGRGGSG